MKPSNLRMYKKLLTIFSIASFLVLFGEIKFAWASLFSMESIAVGAITSIAQILAYFVAFICGLFLMLATWAFSLALRINFALLKSPVVLTGWDVILSITNLGFVLAIIVIAFATILHFESYAMKKTLWKLVVAALLVNFSLVIAGSILDISDSITLFIMNKANLTNPIAVGDAIAGLFRAQGLMNVRDMSSATSTADIATSIGNGLGQTVLISFASIFFAALFTLLAALTMTALGFMYLVRYLYLGFLLLFSPIVWLCWVFPSTQKYWHGWWEKFFRWTFFGPIMIFFIWLALATMKGGTNVVEKMTGEGAPPSNITLNFGIPALGDMILVIGILIGGVFVANSLSITGGKQAYGAAMAAASATGGYMGRRTTRFISAPLRAPKEKLDKDGKPIAPTGYNKWRRDVNSKLKTWQSSGNKAQKFVGGKALELGKAYGNKKNPSKINKGFTASILDGAKNGSGLFKKSSEKETEEKTKIKELFDEKKNVETTLKMFEKNPDLTPEDLENKKNMEEKVKEVDEKIMEIYRERAKKITKKDETKKSKKRKGDEIITEREATIKEVGEIEDRLKKIYGTGAKTPADKKEMDDLETKKKGLENKISNLEKEANSSA